MANPTVLRLKTTGPASMGPESVYGGNVKKDPRNFRRSFS
jgi:hypothetical protein